MHLRRRRGKCGPDPPIEPGCIIQEEGDARSISVTSFNAAGPLGDITVLRGIVHGENQVSEVFVTDRL